MTLPHLSDILSRLEASTGADRELDADIAKHTGWTYEFDEYEQVECWRYLDGRARYLPKVTDSVDAAIALAARVLPGWFFEHIGNDAIGEDDAMTCIGWTVEMSPGMSRGFQGQSQTLPVAILISVLRALEEKEGRE